MRADSHDNVPFQTLGRFRSTDISTAKWSLAARSPTVHPEMAALSTCLESQFIIAISLNLLPSSLFKVVEHDLAP